MPGEPYELTADFRNVKKDLDRELHDVLRLELNSVNRDFPEVSETTLYGQRQRDSHIEDACCGHLARTEKKYWQELLEQAPLSRQRRSELIERAINKAFKEIAALAFKCGGYEEVERYRDGLLRRHLADAAGSNVSTSAGESQPVADGDGSGPLPSKMVQQEEVSEQANEVRSPNGLELGNSEIRSQERNLNVELISKWIEHEGYDNEQLAVALHISVRAVSSLRNNGGYHGADALAKLANLMRCELEKLYLP